MPFFEALNIEKSYSNHKALDNVSVHVPKGSVYGLLGPNGAGKTTLIRIINQITAPDKGQVLFNGQAVKPSDVLRIGYLPEERGLYKKMKVGEQALYLAQLKGLSKQVAKQRLLYWFKKFEIDGWWNKKVEELSKGMAQKIQFIVTVLHEPELLIFDEPFSGFDPVNASMLKQEVQMLKENGTTIILSTHDMSSVEELCDHITLINKSKAIIEGKVHEIREQYKDNLYELAYYGETHKLAESLKGICSIESNETQGKMNITQLRLIEEQKDQAIIAKALSAVDIKSYREVLPSMNDIFIKAVGKPTS